MDQFMHIRAVSVLKLEEFGVVGALPILFLGYLINLLVKSASQFSKKLLVNYNPAQILNNHVDILCLDLTITRIFTKIHLKKTDLLLKF